MSEIGVEKKPMRTYGSLNNENHYTRFEKVIGTGVVWMNDRF